MKLLSLGANIPDSETEKIAALTRAIAQLRQSGVTPVAQSRWFASAAWPEGRAAPYVNGVIAVKTTLPPRELLLLCLGVEKTSGQNRAKEPRGWAARRCDIDLLAYEGITMPDAACWRTFASIARWRTGERPELVLPHPMMAMRAFVLAPLEDIAPDWLHPVFGESARTMRAALAEAERDSARPLTPLPGTPALPLRATGD